MGAVFTPARGSALGVIRGAAALAAACGAAALAWPGAATTQETPLPPPPPAPGFELTHAETHPEELFYDAGEAATLSYEFTAAGPVDVRVELVRHGKVKRHWAERGIAPAERHTLSWDPAEDGGPDHGRFTFRIGPEGGVTRPAGSFRLRDHLFPIRASHRYGDRFGVPRSGGRTHEGQDVWASCRSELVAARGGKVQGKGYSGALYGYFVTIDGTGTDRDYFYAHLAGPSPLGEGARVRTGDRIGAIGKTGNASGEGCQLHFELWPHGYRDGQPADPLHDLRAWDGWS